MNVVDSSGRLAYFADEPNADHFLIPLKDLHTRVVPTVIIYEVFKVVSRETDDNQALKAIMAMHHGRMVDIDASNAVAAAKLSLEHGLPITDSIILATARAYEAVLWTQDSDFKDIHGVHYFPKPGL
jgi:toxin FitB